MWHATEMMKKEHPWLSAQDPHGDTWKQRGNEVGRRRGWGWGDERVLGWREGRALGWGEERVGVNVILMLCTWIKIVKKCGLEVSKKTKGVNKYNYKDYNKNLNFGKIYLSMLSNVNNDIKYNLLGCPMKCVCFEVCYKSMCNTIHVMTSDVTKTPLDKTRSD